MDKEKYLVIPTDNTNAWSLQNDLNRCSFTYPGYKLVAFNSVPCGSSIACYTVWERIDEKE